MVVFKTHSNEQLVAQQRFPCLEGNEQGTAEERQRSLTAGVEEIDLGSSSEEDEEAKPVRQGGHNKVADDDSGCFFQEGGAPQLSREGIDQHRLGGVHVNTSLLPTIAQSKRHWVVERAVEAERVLALEATTQNVAQPEQELRGNKKTLLLSSSASGRDNLKTQSMAPDSVSSAHAVSAVSPRSDISRQAGTAAEPLQYPPHDMRRQGAPMIPIFDGVDPDFDSDEGRDDSGTSPTVHGGTMENDSWLRIIAQHCKSLIGRICSTST